MWYKIFCAPSKFPPPLPKRFIRPCDVIGAFSGGHKAIFRLDAPSSNRRRKTRRVWLRIYVSRSEHSNQMRHMFRGISTCDAAGVMLARPTWLRNVKSNHYGRCYPIRVNIRKGIVPVLIRSWRTRAYTTVFWIFWLLKRLNPVVCIIIKLTMKGYSDWSR